MHTAFLRASFSVLSNQPAFTRLCLGPTAATPVKTCLRQNGLVPHLLFSAALLITLLFLPSISLADATQDAVNATRAREIARASDPDGSMFTGQVLGYVLLPAAFILLLLLATKGRR